MRAIIFGIGISLLHAITVSFVAAAIFYFGWPASLYQKIIYWVLSFVIFFLGGRYGGRKIILPTLISYIFLNIFVYVYMVIQYNWELDLTRRVSFLLLELAAVSIVLIISARNGKTKSTRNAP